jgi:[glutamine synthetase] adenylyltransferase / [glutamine synthetase]-adenylyl-L-tyrosine phosphorylase
LITSMQSFVEHHSGEREVWERQMMTRCRPIHDPAAMGAEALRQIQPHVYAVRDREFLRREIHDMRQRVERELGRPRGKFELKRGPGGVMDVDFACHFLQLVHGPEIAALRTCSTRAALASAVDAGVLDVETGTELTRGYEYLRRLETCLRLFELRNVSSFPLQPQDCAPLARAMTATGDTGAFMGELERNAAAVRSAFQHLLRPH